MAPLGVGHGRDGQVHVAVVIGTRGFDQPAALIVLIGGDPAQRVRFFDEAVVLVVLKRGDGRTERAGIVGVFAGDLDQPAQRIVLISRNAKKTVSLTP